MDPDGLDRLPTAVRAAAAAMDAAIDELQTAATSPWSVGENAEALTQVVRLRARVEAAYLHVVRGYDARPDRPPTAGDAAAHLVHACGMDGGTAHKDVLAARAVDVDGAGFPAAALGEHDGDDRDGETSDNGGSDAEGQVPPTSSGLPRLGLALARGEVNRAHVDAAVATSKDVPRHLLDRVDEEGWSGAARIDAFLSEHARRLSPRQVRRLGRQLVATLAPEAEDRYDPDACTRRHLSMRRDSTGMLLGSFALDPAAGAVVRAAIDSLVAASYSTTKATEVPPAGDGAQGDTPQELPLPDDRTPAQRRADALTDMARAALSGATTRPGASGTGPNDARGDGRPAGREAPLVQVHIVGTAAQIAAALASTPPPVDAFGRPMQPPAAAPASPRSAAPGLAVDTRDGEPVDAAVLGRLLCEAGITATALSASGAVLAHGRATRLVTPAQRRALIARDRGCIVPGCAAPPSICDAHHVTWWRHGGRTDIDNLALVCTRHHTAVHAGTWRLQIIDGVPWAVPPPILDPDQRPRRNTVPEAEHQARRLGHHLRAQRRQVFPLWEEDLPDTG